MIYYYLVYLRVLCGILETCGGAIDIKVIATIPICKPMKNEKKLVMERVVSFYDRIPRQKVSCNDSAAL